MPRKKRKKEKRKSISKISNEIESSERQNIISEKFYPHLESMRKIVGKGSSFSSDVVTRYRVETKSSPPRHNSTGNRYFSLPHSSH